MIEVKKKLEKRRLLKLLNQHRMIISYRRNTFLKYQIKKGKYDSQ